MKEYKEKDKEQVEELKTNLSCCYFHIQKYCDAINVLEGISTMESKFNSSLSSLKLGMIAEAHKYLSECYSFYKVEQPDSKTNSVLQAQYTSIFHNATADKKHTWK